VLQLTTDDRTLRHLQLEALLPLELALMGNRAESAGTPEELLWTARAALSGLPRLAPGGPDS
jgi:hypothetical protein